MIQSNTQYSFLELQKIIRQGQHSNHPEYLYRYLKLCDKHAQGACCYCQKAIYHECYRLLLETMCDALIEYHWRYLCLDYIYQPLAKIKQLVKNNDDKERYDVLVREVNICSHYYL